jgi:hypothetical protein
MYVWIHRQIKYFYYLPFQKCLIFWSQCTAVSVNICNEKYKNTVIPFESNVHTNLYLVHTHTHTHTSIGNDLLSSSLHVEGLYITEPFYSMYGPEVCITWDIAINTESSIAFQPYWVNIYILTVA